METGIDLLQLIDHPEDMDKDTLYELRSLLAVHPYYQTVRLLMLQNLYILHDPSFDEELRRAAIYITDRRVIFNLVEAAHYQFRKTTNKTKTEKPVDDSSNRTISLIDDFLSTMPKEEDDEKPKKEKRKPTPADAAVDYVSYLLQVENEETADTGKEEDTIPEMRGQNLIDNFIENDNGKIQLNENPQYLPQISENGNTEEKEGDESYFTETLARIYIKQGRYSKALEIIRRLSLDIPQKNAYFADQIRFLQKLIINNKNK
jgi:hypothetical protein